MNQMFYFKIMNNKADAVMIFLFLLLVPALVSGPFLPDAFLSIIGLIFLIKSFFNKDLIIYYDKKFSLIFLTFFSTIIISSTLSDDILSSFESSLFYFRFYFFSIGVFYLLSKYTFIQKYFLLISLITLCFLSIDSIYQTLFKSSMFLSLPLQNEFRASSLFGEELKLGNFIVRLLPLIYALLTINLYKNKFIIFIIILLGSSILVSGERTALGLLILFLSGIFFIDLNYKKFFLTVLALTVIITGILFTENNIKERMISHTYSQIFDVKDGQFNIFSPQHTGHYKTAIKIFVDRPFIGIGPKMYRYECSDPKYKSIKYACTTHPHNTYIQLLAETGFLGFIQIFSLFFYVCFKLIKFIFKENISNYEMATYLLFLSIFLNLWPIIPTFNFFNNWINVIFYIPIGFLLYFKKQNKKNV